MKIANHPRRSIIGTILGLACLSVWGMWRALVSIATATELPAGLSHFWNWYGKPSLALLNASYPSAWLLAGLGIIITSVVLDRFWDRIPFQLTLKESTPARESSVWTEAVPAQRARDVASFQSSLPSLAEVLTKRTDPPAELEITFARELNYTVHESGLAEARIWIWNRSTTAKVKNLRVKVESLRALTNKKKAQRYAMSFTNFDLHLERSSPGASLDADSHVEVFVVKNPKCDPMLYFISAEQGKIYQTPAASYVVTIRTTSDNCATVRQAFKIGFASGVMTFKKCDAINERKRSGAVTARARKPTKEFTHRWRTVAENGQTEFTITLEKCRSARKSHVPTLLELGRSSETKHASRGPTGGGTSSNRRNLVACLRWRMDRELVGTIRPTTRNGSKAKTDDRVAFSMRN